MRSRSQEWRGGIENLHGRPAGSDASRYLDARHGWPGNVAPYQRIRADCAGHDDVRPRVDRNRRQSHQAGRIRLHREALSLENVTLRVKHALEQYRLEEENRSLRTKVQRKFELVGQSPAMQQLRQLIDTAGPTNSRVLVGGENGTGKELVARAIHLQSARADRPFVAVNCAAIPETLIESELFGHEKGSFTWRHLHETGTIRAGGRRHAVSG